MFLQWPHHGARNLTKAFFPDPCTWSLKSPFPSSTAPPCAPTTAPSKSNVRITATSVLYPLSEPGRGGGTDHTRIKGLRSQTYGSPGEVAGSDKKMKNWRNNVKGGNVNFLPERFVWGRPHVFNMKPFIQMVQNPSRRATSICVLHIYPQDCLQILVLNSLLRFHSL